MPKLIDLYCGRGGWSRGLQPFGFDCYGFDIDARFASVYPGTFTCCDVRDLRGENMRDAALIVASPPCLEFSRFQMPWTRARNPPPPELGLELVAAAYRIAKEAGRPLILENVRAAQRWLGRAVWHSGPFYLWGDGVPALMPPAIRMRPKEGHSSARADLRAEIPLDLAAHMGRIYA